MEREFTSVLDFWFRELTPDQWFLGAGPDLDDLIRNRFGRRIKDGREGELDAWANAPRGRLALILLPDQFSRNVFRNSPEAFAGDAKAQALSREGIQAEMDKPLIFVERQFFYMPLMHAEDADLQALSIAKFTELRDEAALILDFAKRHQAAVARFGRFQQRNVALGRASTPEEEAFLASDENRF